MSTNAFKKRSSLLVILSIILIQAISAASFVNIHANNDTYVDEFNPSDNYGKQMTLDVGIRNEDPSKRRCRAFLKFDLSGIPSNSVINNATLNMHINYYKSTEPPTQVGAFFVFHGPWDELTAAWNTPPNDASFFHTNPTDSKLINSTGPVQFNVTNDVTVAHNSVGVYSILIKLVDDTFGDATNFMQFHSRESSQPTLWPTLNVTYSPPNLTPTENTAGGYVRAVLVRKRIEDHDTTGMIQGEALPDPGEGIDLVMGATNYSDTKKYKVIYVEFEEDVRPSRIDIADSDDSDSPTPKTKADLNYDSLGRFQEGWFNPPDSDIDDPVEVKFDYDTSGNLTRSDFFYSGFHNGPQVNWLLDYNSDSNIDTRYFLKRDNTPILHHISGSVNYYVRHIHPLNFLTRIYDTQYEPVSFEYDDMGRLIAITSGTDQQYLREYGYYPSGRLAEFSNHQDDEYNSALFYLFDRTTGLLSKIYSQTNYIDAEHVFLGQLSMQYNTNGTLKQAGYTTNEDTSVTPGELFETSYVYDGQDRLVRAEFDADDPEVPDIVLVIDPETPVGSYIVTHHVYDNLGRLIWTIGTDGNITRTIYNQGPDFKHKKMARLEIKGNKVTGVTSFESDSENNVLRSTNLEGRFLQNEYDAHGHLFESYLLGSLGLGECRMPQKMFSQVGFNNSPDTPLMIGWDQYGELDIVLDYETVGLNGDAAVKVSSILSSKRTRRRGCLSRLSGDSNGDCKVNFKDFVDLSTNWMVEAQIIED